MIFCKPNPTTGGCDIATGDLYLDDGSTLDQGSLLLNFQQKGSKLTVTSDSQGYIPTGQRINQIEYYGYE